MEKGNLKVALIIGLAVVIIVSIVAIFVVFKENNEDEIDKNNVNSSNIEQNSETKNQEVNSNIPEPDSVEQIEPDSGTQLVE